MSKFIEGGIKRNLTQADYDAINWVSYYAAGHNSYNEARFIEASKVILDLLADKVEAKSYSNWIIRASQGHDFDFHKLQDFCIELLQHYKE